MRSLVRRVSALEDAAQYGKAAAQYDWSDVEDADLDWLNVQFEKVVQADGEWDYSNVSCKDLSRMELLLIRCRQGVNLNRPGIVGGSNS